MTEQYPATGGANTAAAGAIPAAPNPGYPVNFDTQNGAAGGANAAAAAAGANAAAAAGANAAAAAGAIPAAPNPGYPVNFNTLNAAAGGGIPAAPNPGYPVSIDTPFGNLRFNINDLERAVFMIFVAILALVAVAYMIMKLVKEGEGKNRRE